MVETPTDLFQDSDYVEGWLKAFLTRSEFPPMYVMLVAYVISMTYLWLLILNNAFLIVCFTVQVCYSIAKILQSCGLFYLQDMLINYIRQWSNIWDTYCIQMWHEFSEWWWQLLSIARDFSYISNTAMVCICFTQEWLLPSQDSSFDTLDTLSLITLSGWGRSCK